MSAYILEAIRAPRGKGRDDGSLHSIKPIELLKQLFEGMQERTNLDPSLVEEVILGCVTPINDQGANIAQAAALYSGWKTRSSASTVNSFCTSGLTACSIAAAKLQASMGDLYAIGGIESMSRVPMMSDKGPAFADPHVSRALPFIPNPLIADIVANRNNFSRQALDEFASASHHKAAEATEKGYFKRSLIPIKDETGAVVLDRDENIRPTTSVETMAKLEPLFARNGIKGFEKQLQQWTPEVTTVHHHHHAGNAPSMVDGASLALVGNLEAAHRLNLKPRARILVTSTARGPAHEGLSGALHAAKDALKRANLTSRDIDLWECNEGFASIVMNFARELDVPHERLNVNGGGIAMGHAMGATGVNLISMLVDELERRDLKTGLIAISGAIGIGAAVILERTE